MACERLIFTVLDCSISLKLVRNSHICCIEEIASRIQCSFRDSKKADQNVPSPHGMSPNANFQSASHPSATNLNIPPIIAQTLELAAAAPPPPSSLTSQSTQALNDSIDRDSAEQTEEPPRTTEKPNPTRPTERPNSARPTVAPTSSWKNPANTVNAYHPLLLFHNPLNHQAAVYSQYNTFVPYERFLYPFHRNIQSQTQKTRTKPNEKIPPNRSKPFKNIVININ